MKAWVPAAILLALAACGPAVRSGGPPPHAATLGEIDLDQDLTLQGTEPFWAMRIGGREIRFDRDDIHAAAPNPGPLRSANTAVWKTRTADGVTIKAVLTAEKCSDGMGPHDYPLKAMVRYGAQRFDGCADTTQALRQPEVGDPDAAPIKEAPSTGEPDA